MGGEYAWFHEGSVGRCVGGGEGKMCVCVCVCKVKLLGVN